MPELAVEPISDDRAEARAINHLPTLEQRRHALEQIARQRGQEEADRIKRLAFNIWPEGARP